MNWFVNAGEQRLRAGWRLMLQFLMMLFFMAAGYYGVYQLAPEMTFFLNSIVSMVAFTLSVWVAVRYLDKRPFYSLGLRFDRDWMREMLLGFGIAALAVGTIFLIELMTGWIRFTGFGWERAWNFPYPVALLGYFTGMLMVGFYEELVFRGYQITNMIEGFTGNRLNSSQAAVLAILVSSGIFGVLHAGNPNASVISTLSIIIAGAVLAVPYLLTGRLALSVGLHTGWNFAQGGIFGFPVSGSPTRSALFQIRETGPDLFTGGAFGPEAGLLGIMGLVLILYSCYLYAGKSGYPLRLNDRFRTSE